MELVIVFDHNSTNSDPMDATKGLDLLELRVSGNYRGLFPQGGCQQESVGIRDGITALQLCCGIDNRISGRDNSEANAYHMSNGTDFSVVAKVFLSAIDNLAKIDDLEERLVAVFQVFL